VIAGGGTAWGLTRGPSGGFRTALASQGTVQQTLSATGTVSPVSRASESFQVAGTVAKVEVKEGQQVHAGQILAHLDRSDLRAQLHSARSSLAAARNNLSNDESGQGSSGQGGASRGSTPTFQADHPTVVSSNPPSRGNGAPSQSGGGDSGGLSGLQTAVRAAQQQTDSDLAIAATALKNANAACAPATTPDAGSTPAPDATSSTGSSSDACTAYSAVLLSDQQDVSSDEQQLANAETALTKAVNALVAAAKQSASTPANSSTPTHQPSTPSSSGSTASAADIALDQATIDQAKASVATARADLAQATLRATIAGRVAAVTVAHGDQVSASSSDPAVLVVGSKQEQATIDFSATEIRHVKLGMTARVVADGSSRAMSGRVVAVNSAGTTSTSGSVSYPVTIALPAGTDVVGGAAAAVTVDVATIDDVLTVPTSAVHYSGTSAYVELLRGGKQVRHTVKVGAMGAALTQIVSGISDGQRIVLADLGAAVPSSSSTLTRGVGGFGGPGGGAGFTRRFAGGGGTGSAPAFVGGPAG
jgi:HlyD family secretion protein